MTLQNKFLRDYRRMFRLVKNGETFCAFDTETTGLKAESCRIIEIGAVKFNSEGILQKFSTLINPNEPIPLEIQKITGITNEMVSKSPAISEVFPKFLDFIQDTIIVGHNAQFDMRFLQAELERAGKAPVTNDVIDTLGFCRWAYPDLKKYNQPFMAEQLSIPVSNAHRAYDDAFVCGNIFLRCIYDTASRQKN